MTNQEERRSSERATVMLSAVVAQPTGSAQVRMANLSREGAAVIGPELAQYTKVVLRRDGKDVAGRVVWVDGSCSGLRFEQPTELDSMLPRISKRRPALHTRPGRPGLKCAPLSPADRMILERWATAGACAVGD
jgi:PilZ domain-containing protein